MLMKKKKKKMYQAETISLVINWSSSGRGDITAKCQDYLFIYLFIFLLGGSSAVRSISVQSLLFSEVIKKSIDLSVSDSYLLPSPLVLCFVLPSGPPGERKVCFADAERLALLLLHSAHRQWHGDLGAQPNLRIDISTWKSSCYWLGATLLCAKYHRCIFLNQINDKTGSRLPSALGERSCFSFHWDRKWPVSCHFWTFYRFSLSWCFVLLFQLLWFVFIWVSYRLLTALYHWMSVYFLLKNIFIKNSSNSISTEEIFCTGGKHGQHWKKSNNFNRK